jgi:hypothetical protein
MSIEIYHLQWGVTLDRRKKQLTPPAPADESQAKVVPEIKTFQT